MVGNRLRWFAIRAGLTASLIGFANPTVWSSPPTDGLEFFERRIRPVLVDHCYACHSSATASPKGGLRLDSRDGIRQGGKSGPAVVPERVQESLLVAAVRYESLQMPPKQPLPDAMVADLVHWIEMGAPDPRDQPPSAEEVSALTWQQAVKSRRNWWSLQPVARYVPPHTPTDRSANPLDAFISAKLQGAGLQPAPPADDSVILRRLTFVLTGLPPTLVEQQHYQEEIVRYDREMAYQRLVDRLMASPRLGERWARHWMDVVRYAETHGYEWNHEVRDAWRYRDYLIRAINADIPYDQLLREHIAGDLLTEPRMQPNLHLNESVIATAFWRFGELGHDNCVQFPEIRYDAVDNQIDTLTKAFQAMTVSCARCHDHKVDAISTQDYYALVGIVESSRQLVQTIDTADRFVPDLQRLQRIRSEIQDELARLWLPAVDELKPRLVSLLAGEDSELTPSTKTAANATAATSPNPTINSPGEPIAFSWTEQLVREDLNWDDPLRLVQRIRRRSPSESVASLWTRLRSEYAQEQASRAKFNAEQFEPWADFRSGWPEGWRASGHGLSSTLPATGEIAVATRGSNAVAGLLMSGLYTHRISDRLNGTLQSPWIPTHRKYVSLQFQGGGLSMIRAVVDSCVLNEFAGGGAEYVSHTPLRWKTFPTHDGPHHRSYLDLTTTADNPRWPDRPGMAKSRDPALKSGEHSWFGVVRAVLHDSPEPPQAELQHLLALWPEAPQSVPLSSTGSDASRADDAIDRIAATIQGTWQRALRAWAAGVASESDIRWIDWLLSIGWLPQALESSPTLSRQIQLYRELEAQLPPPRVVAAMADQGPGFDAPVLLRGNPADLGPIVPRRYLEVLCTADDGGTPDATHKDTVSGSGRSYLAERITDPRNPLTARVLVNRLWHHAFGTGIVSSTDDFGHLGDLPSHPELLDFLAQTLVRDRWSLKQLLRQIVTSQTFRQASQPTVEGLKVDPDNRLLHHYPARRLDAEAVRDTLLSVTNRLDSTLYGPSIDPYRTEAKDHRRLFVGPLDGAGRRSIYIKVTRMEGQKFLELFDLPNAMATRGARDRTNVPAQALAFLNDPFVVEQSKQWGQQLTQGPPESVADRTDRMLRICLGRPPTSEEQTRLAELVQQMAEIHQVTPEDVLSSRSVWQDVAHTILNMKELIFLR